MNIEEFCDHSVLEPGSPTPLYHQIYLLLKTKIEEGELPRESILPGEHALAEAFNVSRITAKRALNELARTGYVLRHRGRGTRVIYGSQRKTAQVSLNALVERGFSETEDEKVEFIDNQEVSVSKTLSSAIGIDENEKIVRQTGVFYKDNEAFAVVYVYSQDVTEENEERAACLSEFFSNKQAVSQKFCVKSAENDCLRYLNLPHGTLIADIELTRQISNHSGTQMVRICGKPQSFQYQC